jgi:hypothetical protein
MKPPSPHRQNRGYRTKINRKTHFPRPLVRSVNLFGRLILTAKQTTD